MADTPSSEGGALIGVRVQVSPRAQIKNPELIGAFIFKINFILF